MVLASIHPSGRGLFVATRRTRPHPPDESSLAKFGTAIIRNPRLVLRFSLLPAVWRPMPARYLVARVRIFVPCVRNCGRWTTNFNESKTNAIF
jgi:hypothetical protein